MTYQIKIEKSLWHLIPTIVIWCYETFNGGGYSIQEGWTMHTQFDEVTFTFYNSKDVMLFKLRWTEVLTQ